jgi:hypothetical protein
VGIDPERQTPREAISMSIPPITTQEPVAESRSHPSWCYRQDCTAKEASSGWHWSRAATTTDDTTGLQVAVRLCQSTPVPGYPRSGLTYVEATVQFPDDGPDHPPIDVAVCFEGEFARSVGWTLITAARDAIR